MGLKGIFVAGSLAAEITLHACEGVLAGSVGLLAIAIAWGHLCIECPWFHNCVNRITGFDLPEQNED